MIHDDDGQEPGQQFTEEEAAFLRYVRFGELPPRILPSEFVEAVEAEQPWLTLERWSDPETGYAG